MEGGDVGFAAHGQLLSRDAGELIELTDVLRDGMVAVVQDVAGEVAGREAGVHFVAFMQEQTGPAAQAAVVEAQLAVGVPAAVAHPVPAIVGEADQRVGCVLPVGFDGANRLAQLVGQHFVSIELEDVVELSLAGGVIFLLDVAGKGMLNDAYVVLAAYFDSGIGGEGIDHQYIVGYIAQRLEAAGNVGCFVEGDDDDGEVNHAKKAS